MAKVDVKCPFCAQTASVKKYGPGSAGHQHYRCQACCRSFQVDYEYRACQPGMKGQVVDLAMYNAGIRNPQGLAINPWSGALWLHEHGPRGGDEINIPEEGRILGDRKQRIRDVRVGPDGYLYVLTDESDGQLLKVSPAATR